MSAYQDIHEMGSHSEFLQDLSCMFDGELDELAAGRAMLHIEECGSCRSFFEDIRDQVLLAEKRHILKTSPTSASRTSTRRPAS